MGAGLGLSGGMGGGGGGLGLNSNLGNMGMMGMGGNDTGLGNMGGGLSSLGGNLGLSNLASSGLSGGGYGTSSLDIRGRDYGNGGSDFRSTSSMSRTSAGDGGVINVGNLPPRFNWQNLRDKCKEVGDVKFAEIHRGVGTVRFSSVQDAQRAVYKLDGIMWDGYRIDVRLA
jgi:hypothetical protein